MKIKVGLIGFGRMGQMYWEEMQKSGRWDIAYICDTDPASENWQETFPLHPESYPMNKKSLMTRV